MLRNRLGYPVDKDGKYYQRRLVRITPTDKLVTTGETTCVGDLTDFKKVVPLSVDCGYAHMSRSAPYSGGARSGE